MEELEILYLVIMLFKTNRHAQEGRRDEGIGKR